MTTPRLGSRSCRWHRRSNQPQPWSPNVRRTAGESSSPTNTPRSASGEVPDSVARFAWAGVGTAPAFTSSTSCEPSGRVTIRSGVVPASAWPGRATPSSRSASSNASAASATRSSVGVLMTRIVLRSAFGNNRTPNTLPGASPKTVQAILGHRSAAFTLPQRRLLGQLLIALLARRGGAREQTELNWSSQHPVGWVVRDGLAGGWLASPDRHLQPRACMKTGDIEAFTTAVVLSVA